MVTATPQDLTTIASSLHGFDIINFEKHDQCGYKIISRHNLGLLALKGLLEKCCSVKNLEYVAENNILDRLFYSFDIKKDTHQFVINSKVHKQLLNDKNIEMKDAARSLLNAIEELPLKNENETARDEYVKLVKIGKI
jgi:hypothetical protein